MVALARRLRSGEAVIATLEGSRVGHQLHPVTAATPRSQGAHRPEKVLCRALEAVEAVLPRRGQHVGQQRTGLLEVQDDNINQADAASAYRRSIDARCRACWPPAMSGTSMQLAWLQGRVVERASSCRSERRRRRTAAVACHRDLTYRPIEGASRSGQRSLGTHSRVGNLYCLVHCRRAWTCSRRWSASQAVWPSSQLGVVKYPRPPATAVARHARAEA